MKKWGFGILILFGILLLSGVVKAADMNMTGNPFLLILIFIFIVSIIFILIYIYFSFAFMSIAKKTNYSHPSVAWIPFVGPELIASKTAKMHWWPILFLVGLILLPINLILGILPLLINLIFFTIWTWKTFKSVRKPGWWSVVVIGIIPWIFIIFLAGINFNFFEEIPNFILLIFGWMLPLSLILYLILLGVVAWSKTSTWKNENVKNVVQSKGKVESQKINKMGNIKYKINFLGKNKILKISLIFFIIFLFVIAICLFLLTSTIKGTVLNSVTKEPIPNAEIIRTIWSSLPIGPDGADREDVYNSKTDTDGNFLVNSGLIFGFANVDRIAINSDGFYSDTFDVRHNNTKLFFLAPKISSIEQCQNESVCIKQNSFDFALKNKDYHSCLSSNRKEDCLTTLARSEGNASICNYIESSWPREFCIRKLITRN